MEVAKLPDHFADTGTQQRQLSPQFLNVFILAAYYLLVLTYLLQFRVVFQSNSCFCFIKKTVLWLWESYVSPYGTISLFTDEEAGGLYWTWQGGQLSECASAPMITAVFGILNALAGYSPEEHGRHAAECTSGDRRDIHLPEGQHWVFHSCQRWLEKITGNSSTFLNTLPPNTPEK